MKLLYSNNQTAWPTGKTGGSRWPDILEFVIDLTIVLHYYLSF